MYCWTLRYVDGMIITGNDNDIKETIKAIKYKYKISKCSPIDFILGINVEKQGYNYSILQKAYIEELLTKFNITNTRKTKIPCTGDNLKENNTLFDRTTYKSAFGSLIYISKCTSPDITFSVGKAARKATISDWKKIINIFKYLNYTKNYKITYNGIGEIVAFTDSDLGGDIKDKKNQHRDK